MAKQWKIAAMLALLMLGSLLFLVRKQPAPVYNGKQLSEWLLDLNTSRKSAAQEAIKHMGSNAIPLLCRELLVTDSNLKLKWIQLAGKQPLFPFRFVPASDRHEHAREAIMSWAPWRNLPFPL